MCKGVFLASGEKSAKVSHNLHMGLTQTLALMAAMAAPADLDQDMELRRRCDVNRDGAITKHDIALILECLNGQREAHPNMDLSEDGEVSPIDALLWIDEWNTHGGGPVETPDPEPSSDEST